MVSETRSSRRSRSRPAPSDAPLDAHFILIALLTVVAALFGGASRENPIRLAAVELSALPVALLAIRRWSLGDADAPHLKSFRTPLLILILVAVVPILQLAPLPPGVWEALPGQAPRVEALRLLGLSPPWLPLTLAPGETRGMALALLPPAAMFLGGCFLSRSQSRRLAALWLVFAVAGLTLGLAQIAEPDGGLAYLYRTTNVGSVVGLFANRNHEAAFLMACLPMAAALAMSTRREARGRPSGHGRPAMGLWFAGLFVFVVVVALGAIRSRAGILLAGPAVLSAIAVMLGRRRSGLGWMPIAALATAATAGVAAVAYVSSSDIIDRFGPAVASGHGELRSDAWPIIAKAATAFLPTGSGLGSFDRVFEAAEPLDLVGAAYFNHAHNDYLELWLETGVAGLMILILFLAWFLHTSWRAWRSGGHLPRAASASIGLLLAASAADYPLRTETLMVFMAFCCAVLAKDHQGGARR